MNVNPGTTMDQNSKVRPKAGTVEWAQAVEAGALALATQQAIEAGKVLAYQRGYNDRMAGRAKFDNMPHVANSTPLEAGAYLQGWNDGGAHIQAIS
jgi:hypothetical protein